MVLRSMFKKLYESTERAVEERSVIKSSPKIAKAVRDLEKRGYKKIGVYKTGSEELYSAVDKAKNAGVAVFGVKVAGSTILLKKQKKGLKEDLLGAAKVAAKGMGNWADRVAPDEKPARKRKVKRKKRQ